MVDIRQESFGERFKYDPQWAGPLFVQRRKTDKISFIAFIIYCLCWISTSFYAFYAMANEQEPMNKILTLTTYDKQESRKSFYIVISSYIAAIFLPFILGLQVLHLLSLVKYAKLIVYTSIILPEILGLIITVTILEIFKEEIENRALYVVVTAITTLFFICIIIVNRKLINIASEVIRQASEVVLFFPSTLLIPYLTVFIQFIIVSLTIINCIFLYYHTSDDKYFIILLIINIFGFYWAVNFVNAFFEVVLSGTFATWYWARDKSRVPSNTLGKFIIITASYHLGTVALGSLITAICKIINDMLESLRDSDDDTKKLIYYALKLTCSCIEMIVRFITGYVYIMCSVHGTDFYDSAKDSFNLVKRNVWLTLFSSWVLTSAVNFLCILIASFSGLIAGLFLLLDSDISKDIRYTHFGICFTICSFICVFTFSVLKRAIDTIYLSVLEDCERNDGTSKPYFMSIEMQNLILPYHR